MNRVAVIGIVGNSVFLPVERFHTGGETVEAESVMREFGGKGFNQAVACARAGAETHFLAAIGKDDAEKVKKLLAEEKIKSNVVVKDGESAYAVIVTDKTGANRVTVFQGVQLDENDVAAFENEIKNSDVLLLNNEVPQAVNNAAVTIAKKYGVKIILNPAPYKPLPSGFIGKIDLFTPNEFENVGLENAKDVVVTLGGEGCYIKSLDLRIPAIKVNAVDTTGAGDTFNGVLAAGISNGKSLNESVQAATVASAISVTRKGAMTSVPTKRETEDFAEKHGLKL